MRCTAIVLFAAFRTLPCCAQYSEEYRARNDQANTQAEMNAWASAEATRADDDFNEIYRALLAKAASPLEAGAKIKAAERAWIAYCDACMDAMYPAKGKQAEYGSIHPLEANLLWAKLTRQQAAAWKDLLKRYNGWRPRAAGPRELTGGRGFSSVARGSPACGRS